MAEIGQILDVARGEIPPCFDGAKNGTVPLTIAAGIADRQLTVGFLK